MTHKLKKFFKPESIAIVGVSRSTLSFGGMSFLMKLVDSNFPGRLYPINPNAGEILGIRAYPSISSLPEVPDLAIVCVSAPMVPDVLEECARIGSRYIHILSAGFKETGTEEGRELEERMATIARENDLLVMGPNCMGPYCPSSGLTAWGAIPGLDGSIGIISQSGAITQRLTEYLDSLGVGVHEAASIGNATVLGITDFLEFMAGEDEIRVIALYLESVQNGREFFHLVREVNLRKPIILLKGGKTDVGASTVVSHTGNMAGSQELWEAFIQQTGIIHVHTINEWADAVLAFCYLPGVSGKGIFLIGGGGGNSVLSADTCILEGLDVPSLSTRSVELLRRIVPVAGSIAGNPLDMWETFVNPALLSEILNMAYREEDIHMVIVERLIPRKAYHMPPDMSEPVLEIIQAIGEIGNRKPTVFVIDSEGGDPELASQGAALIATYCKAGIPAYPSMQRAARALVHLYRYHAHLSSRERREP
jgi:acyl-CoA synthetase (NDP forming)